PGPLHGGVSLLPARRARRSSLARGPLMALTRAARSWSQLVLQVLLLLTGLGLLQVVAERTNHRFDLTPGRELSLSPVTQKLLAEVKDPLRITVFFRRGTKEQYAQLLERLCVQNRQVEFELYDLDRYPDRARTLGVTQYGRAAIEYAGRRTVAPGLPEEELAGGILRALRGRARRIAFTIGHGERAPGGGAESYGRLAGALAAENYVAEGPSLLRAPSTSPRRCRGWRPRASHGPRRPRGRWPARRARGGARSRRRPTTTRPAPPRSWSWPRSEGPATAPGAAAGAWSWSATPTSRATRTWTCSAIATWRSTRRRGRRARSRSPGHARKRCRR